MSSFTIACADIGSVAKGNFAWCGYADDRYVDGQHPAGLVDFIVASYVAGHRIALGFEAPLFVPISAAPERLTSARAGEGNRAWSAGAGAGALATGLTQTTWILARIRERCSPILVSEIDERAPAPSMCLWEAFVSGSAKTDTHRGDARAAVDAMREHLAAPERTSAITAENPLSLIGAAVLWSGCATSVEWLRRAPVEVAAT